MVFLALMESTSKETKVAYVIDDRSTSDVVVRLRSDNGRTELLYCHSEILKERCKYFAVRLSESLSTCQLFDSRKCLDISCKESDFHYHIIVIRLLYVVMDDSVDSIRHGVDDTIGILQVAVELGCPQIITACVKYLEAVYWDRSKDEDILKIIPRIGLQAEPLLARLQPVKPSAIKSVFFSALRFATSSPSLRLNYIKYTALELIEYMVEQDTDGPPLTAKEDIKFEVEERVERLFSRFKILFRDPIHDPTGSPLEEEDLDLLQSYLNDMCWICEILSTLKMMREFVENWLDASENIVKVLEEESSATKINEAKLIAIELVSKILEAIEDGTVILPTAIRVQIVKQWLPFVGVAKHSIDSFPVNTDNSTVPEMDDEKWQALESFFVSIILSLPSGDQAEVLAEWFANKSISFPDLTPVVEARNERSKAAKITPDSVSSP